MKTRRMLFGCLILSLLLLAISSFAGEQRITRSFDAKKLVRINTVSGDCIVEKGSSDRIEVELRYRIDPDDAYEPKFDERENSLKLSERFHGSSSGRSVWRLSVPEGTRIKFSTASGDLSIYGLNSEFSAETASGDIELEECRGEFDFGTASGDITLEACSGEFELNTASGDMQIEECQGEFELSTASGDVVADQVVLEQESSFSTASGSVHVELAKSPDKDLVVSTASGRVTLDYGGNPISGYFEFTARDRRGRIVSPFDFDNEEKFRRWDERYVRKSFTRGSDTPHVYLETASGKVSLREG